MLNDTEFIALHRQAIKLSDAGDLDMARQQYENLLAQNPENPICKGAVLLNLGILEYKTGKEDVGMRLIRESMVIFAGCPLGYEWLAHIYRKNRRYYLYWKNFFNFLYNLPHIVVEIRRIQAL